MTRKDYIALAQAISDSCDKAHVTPPNGASHHEAALQMAQEIAHQIGNTLARDNPLFDWAKWMNACNTGA